MVTIKDYFVKRIIGFAVIMLIFIVIYPLLDNDVENFCAELKHSRINGKIIKKEQYIRGAHLGLTLENGEYVYMGVCFNFAECPLQINDSIVKDSNSLVIKVYRDNALIYTEYNEYYERKLK